MPRGAQPPASSNEDDSSGQDNEEDSHRNDNHLSGSSCTSPSNCKSYSTPDKPGVLLERCPDAFLPGPLNKAQGKFFQTDEQGYPCDVIFLSPSTSYITKDIGYSYTDQDSLSTLGDGVPAQTAKTSTEAKPVISATDSDGSHQSSCTDQDHTYIIEDSIPHNASTFPLGPTNGGDRHRGV